MTELSVPRVCQYCGGSLPPYKPGPARKWCSELCRKRGLYSQPCVDCGAPTHGGDGLRPEPRCRMCNGVHIGRARKVWTREIIVAAIRAWADEYGEPPAMPDWTPATARRLGDEARAQRFEATAGRFPGHMTVVNEFGSWNAAIKAAGFTPRASHGGGGNELRSRRARAAA